MTNTADSGDTKLEQVSTANQSHDRTFYVVEREGMYFKGYNWTLSKIEFTADIMEARWFTHTKAAKPRAGERLLELTVSLTTANIKIHE